MTDSRRKMMRALGSLGWIFAAGVVGCEQPRPEPHRHGFKYTLSTAIAELPSARSLAIGPEGFYLATKEGVLIAGPEGVFQMLPLHRGEASRSVDQVFWGLDCLFVSDASRHRVWRLVGEAPAEAIAGNGHPGKRHDGLANQIPVEEPRAVTTAEGGNVWLLAGKTPGLARLDRYGKLTWLVGPKLVDPVGLCVLSEGRVAIADRGRNQILAWGPRGEETLAGTGEAGFMGDGGQARQARLSSPSAIVRLPDGNLLVADTGNHRVRQIRQDGTIETVAGSGEMGTTDETDDARTARLESPVGLAVAPDGSPFILDDGGHRIYLLRPAATGSPETVTDSGRSQPAE